MATIRKRGKSWQAQIRLADHPPQSKSFSTKAAAEQWARITTLIKVSSSGLVSQHLDSRWKFSPMDFPY